MANKKLIDFDLKLELFFHLLPGTEMDEKEYRKNISKKLF